MTALGRRKISHERNTRRSHDNRSCIGGCHPRTTFTAEKKGEKEEKARSPTFDTAIRPATLADNCQNTHTLYLIKKNA